MTELYPSLILDALRTVRYPGTGKDIVSKLSAAEMMQDEAFFAGINDISVIQGFILFNQLMFLCESLENREDLIIYCFSSKIIRESFRHRNIVRGDTFCSVFTGHGSCKVDLSLERHKAVINSQ